MTPEDQHILADFGSLTYYNTINAVVAVAGYGIFVLGTLIAIQILMTKSWTRSRIALFTCLIIMYFCFTWQTLCGTVVDFISTKYTLIEVIGGSDGFETEVVISDKKALPLQYMQSWPGTIIVLLNDALVVWRAWILFQNSRLPKFTLAFLMVANVGVNIADCIWIDTQILSEAFTSSVLDWLSSVLSLVVNMLATGLIAWMAWTHRQFMAQATVHTKSKAENLLLLLIESGAIFCAIQVVFVVLVIMDSVIVVTKVFHVATGITYTATSCYPAAVTMLLSQDSSPLIETFQITQTRVDPEEDHYEV